MPAFLFFKIFDSARFKFAEFPANSGTLCRREMKTVMGKFWKKKPEGLLEFIIIDNVN